MRRATGRRSGVCPGRVRRAGYERCLRLLTVQPDASGWERLVDRTITARLQRDVTELWRRGWQPADVVRIANRRFGAVHARLATDTIAAEMRAYTSTTVDERWLEQLSALNAQVWWQDRRNYLQEWRDREGLDREAGIACVLEVLSMFAVLPRLEQFGPLPGTARRRPWARMPSPTAVGHRRKQLPTSAYSSESARSCPKPSPPTTPPRRRRSPPARRR